VRYGSLWVARHKRVNLLNSIAVAGHTVQLRVHGNGRLNITFSTGGLIKILEMKFEVYSAMTVKTARFCNVTACLMVEYRRIGSTLPLSLITG
jgi:hypothetical protein